MTYRNVILLGDVREKLREMPAESVHCVVTSPPYWGLRDYGTASWEGGDAECDHLETNDTRDPAITKQTTPAGTSKLGFRDICGKCGAKRIDAQLGLEATPDEYVATMVDVFREVRRVLRRDGVCFINLGDSYYTNPGNGRGSGSTLGGGTPHLSGAQRVEQSGSGGTKRSDSRARVSSFGSLCGECEAALSPRSPDSGVGPVQEPAASISESTLTHKAEPTDHSNSSRSASLVAQSEDASSGRPPSPSLEAVPPLASLASMPPQSSEPLPGECCHCANCGACLEVLRSSSRDARRCARRASYNGGSGGRGSAGHNPDMDASASAYLHSTTASLKHKDLCGIPWRVALALQADGWWLRSDIIWSKPNPMPESVTDRPTKSHEYIFLLTKNSTYFYDAEAVREPAEFGRREWSNTDANLASSHGVRASATVSGADPSAGRNARTVWTIATEAYAEAHFATYPTELVKRCIQAGTSEHGCCSVCGAPWRRVVEKAYLSAPQYKSADESQLLTEGRNRNVTRMGDGVDVRTTGWQPTCKHEAPVEPCLVLDPFMGAGTTAIAAWRAARDYVGIELNPAYLAMAEARLAESKQQGRLL